MRLVLLFVGILVLSSCASSKRKHTPTPSSSGFEPTVNVAHQRSGASPLPAVTTPIFQVISVKSRFLNKDSSFVRVYLNVYIQKENQTVTPEEFSENYMLNYVIYPDYNNRERIGYGNVTLNNQSIVRENNFLTVSFDVKKPTNVATGVMLAELTELKSGRKVLHDLPIRFNAVKLSDRFALFDPTSGQPQLRNYTTINDTIVIRDVSGTTRPLHILRYHHEFEPAHSPMNTTPRLASKIVGADSSMTIMTNQPFVLPQEGLYLFLEDTTNTYGLGLVVADNRYPKITRPEKLIKPILYMSTNAEISELNGARDPKKALDRYWLNLMSGNQDIAKRTIRAYYHRVEEANRLFTTYKEGWKTDKGMIYIILGPPDRVQRSRDREVWVYHQRANASEITFTFNRKANQFVDDHYELVRYVEYQPIWYPVVEAWRTGSVRGE